MNCKMTKELIIPRKDLIDCVIREDNVGTILSQKYVVLEFLSNVQLNLGETINLLVQEENGRFNNEYSYKECRIIDKTIHKKEIETTFYLEDVFKKNNFIYRYEVETIHLKSHNENSIRKVMMPLGVKPKYIFDVDYKQDLKSCINEFKKEYLPHRIAELKGAINRYTEAGLKVNEEWVKEYNELVKELEEANQ